MSSSGGSSGKVNLLDLAAAAVACTVSAGRTIQHISQPRNNNEHHDNNDNNDDDDDDDGDKKDDTNNTNSIKSSNNSCRKNTQLKPDGTLVTDADFAAQGIIVQALLSVSPDICIMGEESEQDMQRHVGKYLYTYDDECLNADILQRTKRELLLRRRKSQQQQQQQQQQSAAAAAAAAAVARQSPLSNGNTCHGNDDDDDFIRHLPLAPITSDSTAAAAGAANAEEEDGSSSSVLLELTEEDLDEVVVDASRVVCIVDPLDGTKSYAHGEYDCVSILIAIIVDNEPHFGVIGKPFGYSGFSSIRDTSCATIYGGPLTRGVFVAGGQQIIASPINNNNNNNNANEEDNNSLPKAVISTSRSTGVVHDFCVHLGEKALISPEPLLISGAGEKSLRLIVQRNNEAIWFFPKPGTYLWDVAASDALLRSLGGKLTNKYGHNLDYSKSREEAENVDGVVACIDSDLHAECIRLFHEGDWINQQ
jgi:3'-phosphoadenosine 5'-phosphosulfate (PAPS) 3'-phosphatase